MMSRGKNYLQNKSFKSVLNFRSMALAVVALSACASVQGCSRDDSIGQGYLVTCGGRCIHEEVVAKEDCKGDDSVWIEQVTDDMGGDSNGGSAGSAPEGSKKAGRCLIQGKAQCEAVAKLPAYAGKDIHWLDLDFQMLDLGGGQYVRFIAKEDYDPQNEPSVRKNMEGDYVCGTYDEVTSGLLDEIVGEDGKKTYKFNREKVSEHTCTKERIDKMKASFEGRSCPSTSNRCGYVDLLRNDNNAFSDEPVGFCSKCDVQQVMCGAKCVDLQNDPKHCGSCGNDCGNGLFCNQGQCISRLECDAPKKLCTNSDGRFECINPVSDETCGATCEDNSGVKCDIGKKCVNKGNGRYECSCSSEIIVDGVCIDPSVHETCGATKENALGAECADNEKCVKDENEVGGYKCLCQSGIVITEKYKDQNSKEYTKRICVEPDSSEYCGATKDNPRGTPCYGNTHCEVYTSDTSGGDKGAAYRCVCDASWELPCYDDKNQLTCLDIINDPRFCGLDAKNCVQFLQSTTKQQCDAEQDCVDGACVCKNGNAMCQGKCVNGNLNMYYCGAKGLCNSDNPESDNYRGVACEKNARCKNGKCICIDGGEKCADGRCPNPASSKTCGTKGKCEGEAGAGEDCTLTGRVCVEVASSIYTCACPQYDDGVERVFCDGKCIDPAHSGSNCGARGLCNSDRGINYRGENCFKDNKVCSYDESTRRYSCVSACPAGLVNCNGDCVSANYYHINKNCSDCDAAHCYTGSADQPFDYRKCRVVDETGKEIVVDNGGVSKHANEMNSPKYCNGCQTKPYREDMAAEEAMECPSFMYCSPYAGTNGNSRCGCRDGDKKCTYEANELPEGAEYLTLCVNFTALHMVGCKACAEGWGNCDGDWTNGCETNLVDSLGHCGQCGNDCEASVAHAFGKSCDNGVCNYVGCLDNYGDCNADRRDGCETGALKTDVNHCGSCTNVCKYGNCEDGTCCWSEQKNVGITGVCCSGFKKWHYKPSSTCWGSDEYRCAESIPSSFSWCWSEVN